MTTACSLQQNVQLHGGTFKALQDCYLPTLFASSLFKLLVSVKIIHQKLPSIQTAFTSLLKLYPSSRSGASIPITMNTFLTSPRKNYVSLLKTPTTSLYQSWVILHIASKLSKYLVSFISSDTPWERQAKWSVARLVEAALKIPIKCPWSVQ